MSERLVAMGVDGARAGWGGACLLRDDATGAQRTELRLYADIATVAADHEPGVVVGIDVPIGLLETGARTCDKEARRILGPRGSSVFPAPNRWMLDHADDFRALAPFITMLAGVGKLECGPAVQKPKQAASQVSPEFSTHVSLAGLIDKAAEEQRLERQLGEKKKHLQAIQAKLDNPNFASKAPPEVVQQQREQVEDLKAQIAALENNLRELREG